MRSMKRLIFLVMPIIGLAVFLVPRVAAPADKEEILAEIQKRYEKSDSLEAEYTRVTESPAMEGVFSSTSQNTAAGVFRFKKPDKLLLDQKEPRAEQLITDGKTVWWYIPEEKLVHRYANVDVYGELKPLLDFLGGMGGLEEHFYVRVIPAGAKNNKEHRLDLARLDEGPGPKDITVWLQPKTYTLVGFKLTSMTGESTVFNFTNVKMNPKLPDSGFTFKAPQDVDVVDEAGGM